MRSSFDVMKRVFASVASLLPALIDVSRHRCSRRSVACL